MANGEPVEVVRFGYRRLDREKQDVAGSLLIGIASAAVLCVVVPAAVVFATPGPSYSSWFGGLSVTALAGSRYAWLIAAGLRRLGETAFWLFSYVFMGLAPMVQERSGVDPSTTLGLNHGLDSTAYLLSATGMLAVLVGGRMASARVFAQSDVRLDRAPRINAPRINRFRLTFLCCLGLAMSVYFVGKVGFGTLFESHSPLGRAVGAAWPDSSTRTVVEGLSGFTLLVGFVGLLQYKREQADSLRRFPWLLFWAVAVTLVSVVNPISEARYVFGTVILAMAASLGLYKTRNRFRVALVLALVALVFILPLADAFRRSSQGDFSTSGPVVTLETGDYDAFAQLNNTIAYVDQNGVTFGKQALGVALFWLPRSLWHSKPYDTGTLLARSRGYDFTNLSAPLWAELYINGGWIVLVVGMCLLGFVLRIADARTEIVLCDRRTPGVLACILPVYSLILLRGSLLQASALLAVILGSYYFIVDRVGSSSARPAR